MADEINFTRTKYLRLRRRYERAVREQAESFTFEGHELLTSYAKYLLEYLATQFGSATDA